ncbi:hypothetical protein ACFYW1_27845 [Streptomyces sp. NPDC002669]
MAAQWMACRELFPCGQKGGELSPQRFEQAGWQRGHSPFGP